MNKKNPESEVSGRLKAVNRDLQKRVGESPTESSKNDEVEEWLSNIDSAFQLINQKRGELRNYRESGPEGIEEARKEVEFFINHGILHPYLDHVAEEVEKYERVSDLFGEEDYFESSNGVTPRGDLLDLDEAYQDFIVLSNIALEDYEPEVDWKELYEKIE